MRFSGTGSFSVSSKRVMAPSRRFRARPVAAALIAVLAVGACSSSAGPGSATKATTTTSSSSSTAPTVPPTVPPAAPATAPPTTVTAPKTTRPPAPTTTTPLTRTEASTKLCQVVNSAHQAVMSDRYVPAALQLASGVSAYGATADPALASATKSMLSAGLHADAEGYSTALQLARPICAALGQPITGPIVCIRAPCPGAIPRAAGQRPRVAFTRDGGVETGHSI